MNQNVIELSLLIKSGNKKARTDENIIDENDLKANNRKSC